MPQRFFSTVACCVLISSLLNISPQAFAQNLKRLPPEGIALDQTVVDRLQQRLDEAAGRLRKMNLSPTAQERTIDVEVLFRAVRLSLEQRLFYKESDIKLADRLLDEADRRLHALQGGADSLAMLETAPSGKGNEKSGVSLIAGGFVSRIDQSVQPFGLVLPKNFDPQRSEGYRLDVWLHGRGDTQTELHFLAGRLTSPGQYRPEETVVLHPFGRHCNAFKFAGETDVYEAIEHVCRMLPIDRTTIAMRGFSMGGAGTWHLAVHDPTSWFAVNPGAGFVDTLVYQGWNDQPPFPLDEVQRKLLNWYDVLPWVTNLNNTRLIAYSGEVDKQRAAAERVMTAAKEHDVPTRHVIGKDMGHKIDDASATLIDSQLAQWAKIDRSKPAEKIDFTTYTTRYADADWLRVTGLREHWRAGRVTAAIEAGNVLVLQTKDITHLELDFAKYAWPAQGSSVRLSVDGQTLDIRDDSDAPGLQCRLSLTTTTTADGADLWKQETAKESRLRKRPGLQGPIDDAFCSPFVFVVPTGTSTSSVVNDWIQHEIKYAQDRWRRLMRGEVRQVRDTDVTPTIVDENHLICFGDFQSNAYLKSIASDLPIGWDEQAISIGDARFDARHQVPVLCYPNPKNADRYVVVNSGMTFREFSNTSNSRQIAMLPDWAVIDCSATDKSIFAGEVVAKGFFNESWMLSSSAGSR
ncbi:MAG: prolyl oligopeptidase family serine peptidase [Pirellulaceae bacterium]